MSVFGNTYARYYALLYRDKDYAAEADYIDCLVRRHAPGATCLLELGCGGGRHAALLAEKGYALTGVDRSAEMLAAAQARRAALPSEVAARLQFAQGDITTLALTQRFDCVLSLFHVISYLPSNAELADAFAVARRHLNAGGIFVFDVWHGPAVLAQRPETRIKRMADDEIAVTRLAEPVLHPNECLVDVNYQVFVRHLASEAVEEIRETHRMRYLFPNEIAMLASGAGFAIAHTAEWLSDATPGEHTWGVCYVLRAI